MKWEKVSLENISTKIGDGLHGTPKYDDSGEFYFINGNNLSDGKILIKEDTKRISSIEYDKIKKELNNKTVLVAINGTLGNIGLYQDEPVALGKSACYINVNEKAEKLYVKYILTNQDFQIYARDFATGSTIKNLGLKAVRDYSFHLPPLPTQRKIASILSAYDDLIENNLKRIKLLEESIRTHYKILMCQNDGSWELQKIEDAYEFSNGYAFYKNGYSEEGKTVIDLGNISESSNLIMTGKEKYVSELLYDDKKKFHLHKYDVIVAMTDMTSRLGILAKVALIDDSNKYILNQRVGRLRSRISYIDHCFLYASLSNEEFRNEMKTKAKGAVQIYFNTKDIIEYEVTLPPIKMIEDFSKVVRPLIDLRFSLNNQNTKLREARDILLPRLMNGQIEVS